MAAENPNVSSRLPADEQEGAGAVRPATHRSAPTNVSKPHSRVRDVEVQLDHLIALRDDGHYSKSREHERAAIAIVRDFEEQYETLASCAREFIDNMWTVRDGDDGALYISNVGREYMTRKVRELDALLSASSPAKERP